MVSKLSAVKVGNKQNSESFWVRGYVFREITSVNLVFGRSGFESWALQTLRASNFPRGPKATFFERSDLCLLGKLKEIGFAALSRHFISSQNTLNSYHKTQIDPERLAPAVHTFEILTDYLVRMLKRPSKSCQTKIRTQASYVACSLA